MVNRLRGQCQRLGLLGFQSLDDQRELPEVEIADPTVILARAENERALRSALQSLSGAEQLALVLHDAAH